MHEVGDKDDDTAIVDLEVSVGGVRGRDSPDDNVIITIVLDIVVRVGDSPVTN